MKLSAFYFLAFMAVFVADSLGYKQDGYYHAFWGLFLVYNVQLIIEKLDKLMKGK